MSLRGVDFISKEVKYHQSCRSNYKRRAERATPESIKTSERFGTHNIAFTRLNSHIESNIIQQKSAAKLTSLHLVQLSYLDIENSKYESRDLKNKIKKEYSEQLKVYNQSKQKGHVISHTSITETNALNHIQCDLNSVKAVGKSFFKYLTNQNVCQRICVEMS